MRLIDADKFKKYVIASVGVCCAKCLNKFFYLLSKFETADAEPVRHAKWQHIENGFVECTACNDCIYIDDIYCDLTFGNALKKIAEYNVTPYCPNCGAKMDLED